MTVPDPPPRRVSVVGSTASGKTTFGRELAAVLALPFIELDAINWGPSWTMIPEAEFQARVRAELERPGWVIDGNYGGRGIRPMVWAMADAIVWLDPPLPVILWRLWGRTTSRIRSGKEWWPGTGNRETFRGAFLSRESLFWWAIKTYRARRRNYARLLASPELAHVRKHRFRSAADARRWLEDQRRAAVTRA